MTVFSVYRLADGALTGATVRGVGRTLALNVPADCGLVEGDLDPLAWRVVDGVAVPHVSEPPAPSAEALWSEVRTRRNELLALCDWTDTASAPARLGAERYAAWQVYRQALRDITTQLDPAAIVWPVRPE